MQKLSKITFVTFLMCILTCSLCLNSYATVPHYINYQGRLADKTGRPLQENSSCNITFIIFDAERGGNIVWQGTYNNVPIQKGGIFNVVLGQVNDTGYDFSKLTFETQYYLQIKVNGEVMKDVKGNDTQLIVSTGYAIRAESAEKAERAEHASSADTISNVSISATPAPNKLLLLDSQGKLPGSKGLLGNNIAVLTGTISNGGVIPLPAGYTQDQCKWMVGLGEVYWGDDQHATQFHITCTVNSSRVVSITTSGGASTANANYVIIGVK